MKNNRKQINKCSNSWGFFYFQFSFKSRKFNLLGKGSEGCPLRSFVVRSLQPPTLQVANDRWIGNSQLHRSTNVLNKRSTVVDLKFVGASNLKLERTTGISLWWNNELAMAKYTEPTSVLLIWLRQETKCWSKVLLKWLSKGIITEMSRWKLSIDWQRPTNRLATVKSITVWSRLVRFLLLVVKATNWTI